MRLSGGSSSLFVDKAEGWRIALMQMSFSIEHRGHHHHHHAHGVLAALSGAAR